MLEWYLKAKHITMCRCKINQYALKKKQYYFFYEDFPQIHMYNLLCKCTTYFTKIFHKYICTTYFATSASCDSLALSIAFSVSDILTSTCIIYFCSIFCSLFNSSNACFISCNKMPVNTKQDI